LNQRLPPNTTAEINYSVNGPDTKEMVAFLEELVEVQHLAIELENRKGLEAVGFHLRLRRIIGAETDERKREILKKAAEKASSVAISYIDASDLTFYHYEALGYTGNSDRPKNGHRTLGLDYA